MSNSRAKSIKHVHAHEAVITNEYWYGDGPPLMHPSLSARKTAERRARGCRSTGECRQQEQRHRGSEKVSPAEALAKNLIDVAAVTDAAL